MNYRRPCAIVGLLLAAAIAGRSQELDQRDLLTRLREAPEKLALAIEARNTERVNEAKPILLEALQKNSCDRPSPHEGVEASVKCGMLAWSLQALDPDSRDGEGYLARPIEAFLAEQIPPAFEDEAAAREMRFSPQYEEWGKAHGMSLEEMKVAELIHGGLVNQAAFIGDPKLGPMFRRGLRSNSAPVVLSSIRGLALLRDKTALPLILSAIERMKLHGDAGRYMALFMLRDYNDPDVDGIIALKVQDEEVRKSILAQPAAHTSPYLHPKM